MKEKVRNITIQILSLLGLALTIKLALIYYVANYEEYALASFCSVNDFIDCDGAARSPLSQFWGIPLAYWGMFFYLTVLFLTFVDKLKNIKFLKFLEVFKNPYSYITFLGIISFIISMILASKSIFAIKKVCILCVITYFIDLFIAFVSIKFNLKNILPNIKDTFKDFISGAKQYPKTLAILIIFAISFLSYTQISFNFVPPALKKHRDIMQYRNMLINPYTAHGNSLGEDNADVVIELYSDYVCPLCYISNIMLHKAVIEFKNVKVIHHNFPFDNACNKYIIFSMHPGACTMSKAALAAKKQNDYWGMSSALYENQPADFKQILELVDKLGLNKEQFEKDFNSKEVQNELMKDIELAHNYRLNSTPTMFINGKQYIGVKPYYTLRKILISKGAEKRFGAKWNKKKIKFYCMPVVEYVQRIPLLFSKK